MIYRLVSVKEVIAKVVRDLGMNNEEIPYQDFIEWIAEALKHIGAFPQFISKEVNLPVENYRATLPCDFHKLTRIFADGKRIAHKNGELMEGADIEENSIGGSNYSVGKNTITWSEREDTIILQYQAIPTDEEGFPLVPDDQSFFDAFFWKIVMQLNIRGYEFKNKQLNDFNLPRQKWNFYCRQARGGAHMPDLQTLERIKNNWISLRPRLHDFEKNFVDSGLPQNRVTDERHSKWV